MDKLDGLLLLLVQDGLWQTQTSHSSLPISAQEWAFLYNKALEHTVGAIVYDAIVALPDALLPPQHLLMKWMVYTDSIERKNKLMNGIVVELSELFHSNGVNHLLLKGQTLAGLYPTPLHRTCGDIDWYFETQGDFHTANGLIKALAIPIEKQAGFSTNYYFKNIEVEHHQSMLDISNPFIKRYLKTIKAEEAETIFMCNNHAVKSLPPLLSVLSVNLHILKHSLSFGVGLRQICDSAMLYHHYSHQLDGNHLKTIYQKLGVYHWVQHLHHLLVSAIGLDENKLPFPLDKSISSTFMLHEILSAGDFGLYDKRYIKNNNSIRTNRLGQLAKHIRMYINLAPMETICFPVMQTYSYLYKIFGRV